MEERQASAPYKKLEGADPRITELLKTKNLSIDDFATLVQPFVQSDHFGVEILAPGLSGASTFVLLPDEALPLFVKLGEEDLISDEVAAFNRVIKDRMPTRIAASSLDRSRSPINQQLALKYVWAGDERRAETLHSALCNGDFTAQQISSYFEELIEPMWRFHASSADNIGMPHFNWPESKIAKIIPILNSFVHQKPRVNSLIKVLNGTNRWEAVQSKLSSKGFVHGDFHTKNVLAIYGSSSIKPFVVDYLLARKGGCPARDWAKLEREIKLLTLRELAGKDFPNVLSAVNRALAKGRATHRFDFNQHVCFLAIAEIRKSYIQQAAKKGSEIPRSEYLYHVLCWELEYLVWNHVSPRSPECEAIVDSALFTLQSLQQAIAAETNDPKRVQIPGHLRRITPFDKITLLGGVVGFICFLWLFMSAYPYVYFRNLTDASSVIKQVKLIAHKYVSPDEMTYEAIFNPGQGDDQYLHLIKTVNSTDLRSLLPFVSEWYVSGSRHSGTDIQATFDRQGHMITLFSDEASRQMREKHPVLFSQDRLSLDVYSVVNDLFGEDLRGIPPEPYTLIDNHFYGIWEPTTARYRKLPPEWGAPFSWNLDPGSPRWRGIYLEFSSPATLIHAQYTNRALDQLLQRYRPDATVGIGPSEIDPRYADESKIFPWKSSLKSIDISQSLNVIATFLITLITVGAYIVNRRDFARRHWLICWTVALIATGGESLEWWLEHGHGLGPFQISLLGIDWSDQDLTAKFCIGGATVVVLTLVNVALTRLVIHYGTKRFAPQVSTILALFNSRHETRPAGLSLVRGISGGFVFLAIHAGISSLATHYKIGALTSFLLIPTTQGTATSVGEIYPIIATLNCAFYLVVASVIALAVGRAAPYVTTVILFALYGLFFIPGVVLLHPALAMIVTAIVIFAFVAVFNKFDLLTAAAWFMTVQSGLVSLPTLILFEGKRSFLGCIPLCWLVLATFSIFLFLRKDLVAWGNRIVVLLKADGI